MLVTIIVVVFIVSKRKEETVTDTKNIEMQTARNNNVRKRLFKKIKQFHSMKQDNDTYGTLDTNSSLAYADLPPEVKIIWFFRQCFNVFFLVAFCWQFIVCK